jgi:anaerobic selenocysteine-containing dehydrogenase
LEIVQGLAGRVGLAEVVAGSASDWKRRVISPKLGSRGITLETLEAGPIRNPIPPQVLFADRNFPTATGRVNLVTAPPPSAEGDPGYPLFMMSLSTEKSQSSHWAVAQQGPAVVTVHPEAANGIPDGSLGRLESSIGSLNVRVCHDPRQRKDVAIIPKGGHYRDGRCANVLLRARTTDLGEGGALYDERVKLVPV